MNLPACQVSSPKDFGRVAVLYGGRSSEREVSLLSGKAVLEGLLRSGIDATGLDVDGLPGSIQGYDRVWMALHGAGDEDGRIHGMLDFLNVPYTGSGLMASAICMDKLRSKQLFIANGIDTPAFEVVQGDIDLDGLVQRLGLPVMVKPSAEGSSVGVSKAATHDELINAIGDAAAYPGPVLVESFVDGVDYTVSMLAGVALPSIKIEPAAVFYDYQAKYHSNRTQYSCPSDLSPDEERHLADLAMHACEALGVEGWGRVDFMIGEDRKPWCLEINTIPGMTSHSLVPMAAAQVGVGFDELVWRILETSGDFS
ncbi:MAG: D-alanine--D-alanine ligase [Pseudomonadota bacterium]